MTENPFLAEHAPVRIEINLRAFRVPTVDVLLRIARALKVHLRDIVSEL
jgi:hypothetical protein